MDENEMMIRYLQGELRGVLDILQSIKDYNKILEDDKLEELLCGELG